MDIVRYLKIAKEPEKMDYKKASIQCSCGSDRFLPIRDASLHESTAKWLECTCGKKYDVRVNLITQDYLDEIERKG